MWQSSGGTWQVARVLLRVGHVVALSSSSECDEIERQSLNILVLPNRGKPDSTRSGRSDRAQADIQLE